MKATLLCCALTLAALSPATGGTVYSGRQMEWTSPCNPATYIGTDGKHYWRAENCRSGFSQFSSIGIPLHGDVLRTRHNQARRFRPLPDGRIQLY